MLASAPPRNKQVTTDAEAKADVGAAHAAASDIFDAPHQLPPSGVASDRPKLAVRHDKSDVADDAATISYTSACTGDIGCGWVGGGGGGVDPKAAAAAARSSGTATEGTPQEDHQHHHIGIAIVDDCGGDALSGSGVRRMPPVPPVPPVVSVDQAAARFALRCANWTDPGPLDATDLIDLELLDDGLEEFDFDGDDDDDEVPHHHHNDGLVGEGDDAEDTATLGAIGRAIAALQARVDATVLEVGPSPPVFSFGATERGGPSCGRASFLKSLFVPPRHRAMARRVARKCAPAFLLNLPPSCQIRRATRDVWKGRVPSPLKTTTMTTTAPPPSRSLSTRGRVLSIATAGAQTERL